MSDSGMYGDDVYEAGDAVEDAENLDPVENLTGDDPDEIMQTSYVPPDREPHNLRHAPTPFEEREGESLDERLSEEQPDITADDIDVADEGAHPEEEKDEIATDVGPAGYASSAEEAAVHIQEDAG